MCIWEVVGVHSDRDGRPLPCWVSVGLEER